MKNKLKITLALLLLANTVGCSTLNDGYLKVGAGYKVEESDIIFDDGSTSHPLGARFEVGIEKEAITYGVAHYSQWLTGWPVNDDQEYSRTEIFIDYKFKFVDE